MICYNHEPLHNHGDGGKRNEYFVCGILIQETLQLPMNEQFDKDLERET